MSFARARDPSSPLAWLALRYCTNESVDRSTEGYHALASDQRWWSCVTSQDQNPCFTELRAPQKVLINLKFTTML